tara:strand:- start:1237 stop:1641 length:405 start_codon:yes stop_codon:yes gene_type:complete
MHKTLIKILLSTLILAVNISVAHHSASALFDMTKMISIDGQVTEVWFENPHSRIYIEHQTDDNNTELWEIETMSPNWFIRRGWDEDTIKEGGMIRAEGHPARDGSNRIILRILDRENIEIYRWIRPAPPIIKNL